MYSSAIRCTVNYFKKQFKKQFKYMQVETDTVPLTISSRGTCLLFFNTIFIIDDNLRAISAGHRFQMIITFYVYSTSFNINNKGALTPV